MRQVVEAVEQMDEECQAGIARALIFVAALAGIYVIVQTYRDYLAHQAGFEIETRARLNRLIDHVNREVGVAQDTPLNERIKNAGKPAGGQEPGIA